MARLPEKRCKGGAPANLIALPRCHQLISLHRTPCRRRRVTMRSSDGALSGPLAQPCSSVGPCSSNLSPNAHLVTSIPGPFPMTVTSCTDHARGHSSEKKHAPLIQQTLEAILGYCQRGLHGRPHTSFNWKHGLKKGGLGTSSRPVVQDKALDMPFTRSVALCFNFCNRDIRFTISEHDAMLPLSKTLLR